MRIAIDIDGVIDRLPEFFSKLTTFLKGHYKIYILTARSNNSEAIATSLKELEDWKIHFDDYFFLPEISERNQTDFPNNLKEFDCFLWQKAEFCKTNKIDIFFEDNSRICELVKIYSPNTIVFHVKAASLD